MENLDNLYNAILDGDLEQAVAVTQEAINQKITPDEIINGYMIKAMGEIGRRFEEGEAFVPELLMAARAMKGSLALLKPLMRDNDSAILGKVLIGTVKGDLHDIGKNLVGSMLEGNGFEVVNLGVDVSPEKFVSSVKELKPQIICMSALLTTTMNNMKSVIDALDKEGIRNEVKVMIGGAPITQKFADSIGADGFSTNANSAVAKAKELIGVM
jgi:corrinoid protein of di/trimethylamine methyltransferase